jgi:hypothetical protein
MAIWVIGATTIMIIANENSIKKDTQIHQSANNKPTLYIGNEQKENHDVIQERINTEEAPFAEEVTNEEVKEQIQILDIKRYNISVSNRENEAELERFKRLYPSSITTQESIGCDNYLPNFTEQEEIIYKELYPYYDHISDRRLIDIGTFREKYSQETVAKVSMQITFIDKNKEKLQYYIDQPERYYIRKIKQQWEYTHYNEKMPDWYNIEIYDTTKTVKPISDKMLQSLADRRQKLRPRIMRKDWFHLHNTYLYDIESMQRYIKTFNPTCGYYNAYDGNRERKINIDEVIKDRQEYSEGKTNQLAAKPSRWRKKHIKTIEEQENGAIAFVYGLQALHADKDEWYQMGAIGVTTLMMWTDWVHVQTTNGDLSLQLASPEDPQDMHGRLLGAKKEDGSREKVKYMPICHTYIEQNRKSVFDENSRNACNKLIEEFLQNFLDWIEESQELERVIELSKKQIAYP